MIETVPTGYSVELHCVPPETYSSLNVDVNFSPSCGSTIRNAIIVTETTAWGHREDCSCKADTNAYSVQRKIDFHFDGASKIAFFQDWRVLLNVFL